MEKSEGGITSGTPIHLKNSHHTHIALGQWKKRWREVSTLPTQPKHSQGVFRDHNSPDQKITSSWNPVIKKLLWKGNYFRRSRTSPNVFKNLQ
jgi:hypothetical protein